MKSSSDRILTTHTGSLPRPSVGDGAVIKRLAEVGTEAVGSSSSELDGLTHQQFELYRGIVQSNKSLLGSQ